MVSDDGAVCDKCTSIALPHALPHETPVPTIIRSMQHHAATMAPKKQDAAPWNQTRQLPVQTRNHYKKQEARERQAAKRDAQLIAMHEQQRKTKRDRFIGDSSRRLQSAPGGAGALPEAALEGAQGIEGEEGAPLEPKEPKARPGAPPRQKRPKRRGLNALASNEPAQFRLTQEEKQHRANDQISNVINQLIRGRRQLYGTMMRDAESAFKAIDKDGSGALDYVEFAAAMKRLGLGLREDQTMELAKMMDTDGDGEIDCEEFVTALKEAQLRAAGGNAAATEGDGEPVPEVEAFVEPEPEEELVVVETPREPTVAEMTPMQRTDLFFKAVLAEDEPTITKLLDGGVPMDVTRTDQLTQKDETPMEVAVAEVRTHALTTTSCFAGTPLTDCLHFQGKLLAVEVMAASTALAQQQLVCDGLMAKHSMIHGFTSKVQRGDDEFKSKPTRTPHDSSILRDFSDRLIVRSERSVVALRPWRNSKAVDACTDQLTELDVSHKAEVARVLTRRAKLYIDVHVRENAVADYSAVLALCPIDPTADYDDLRIATLIRRGIVQHFSKQDQMALKDLEKGWQLFNQKRESMRMVGEAVFPTLLLDKAAHLIHTIKFRLHMEEIDQRERRLPRPVSASETGEDCKSKWATAKQGIKDAETLGVDLIWLLEWTMRNEINGFAETFCRTEKGVKTVDAVQVAANCQPHNARKAVLAVMESRVLGPLRPGLEARVVKANRFNRVLVNCTGNRLFWYACADLKQLPLTHGDIKKRFDAIDEGASGHLDRGEVAQVAASLGAELNEKQLNEAMEAMDHDGSGEVDLEQFIGWFEHEQKESNSNTTDKVKRAAWLTFGKDDRVSLKLEASARLENQAVLPTTHERSLAYIEDHENDDDFADPPTEQQAHENTTQHMIETLVKPATRETKQSYAGQYLMRPVLKKATHYVVHNPEDMFWDTLHGLLLHQLGLECAVELREMTADQMVNMLRLHFTRRGALNFYALDFLMIPMHSREGKTPWEMTALRKVIEKEAIANAGHMVLVLQSAVETPAVLSDPLPLKSICNGMETGADLELTLSYSALDALSRLLWTQLAATKRQKNALSVVYGGCSTGAEDIDPDVIDNQLAHALSFVKKRVDGPPSEASEVYEPAAHPVSWRTRKRPMKYPAVRRKEKELLSIQAERSEMKKWCAAPPGKGGAAEPAAVNKGNNASGSSHLGVLLSTLLADRQKLVVANVGKRVPVPPPERSESAPTMPGGRHATVETAAPEAATQQLAGGREQGGVDRSQVGRVRRQVDEMMDAIRPSLLTWTRSAV